MKRIINVIISLLILVLLPFSAVSCTSHSESAQKSTEIPDMKKFEQVKKKLNDLLAQNNMDNFTGSILVSSYGKILFNKGYGMADYEKGVPNTPKTSFNLASITKQFTAMGIMILSDKGLLNVDDKISKYIPWIDHSDEITIHHLLTHTSGLDSTIYQQDIFNKASGDTLAKYIESCKGKKIKLGYEPGKLFSYCNENYDLLGYIIEKISGQSYEDYISQNIFKPLEMNNSGYYHEYMQNENHASGYAVLEPEFIRADMTNMKYVYAAGSLYSSVEDLYKWDKALYSEKLVKKETMDKIFGIYPYGYSYGWFVTDGKDGIKAEQEGIITGSSTLIVRYINKNRLIVVLSNREGGLRYVPVKLIENVLKELE